MITSTNDTCVTLKRQLKYLKFYTKHFDNKNKKFQLVAYILKHPISKCYKNSSE